MKEENYRLSRSEYDWLLDLGLSTCLLKFFCLHKLYHNSIECPASEGKLVSINKLKAQIKATDEP